MEEQLKEILNSLYEAEGLVELALRRSDAKVRERIVSLAVGKCFATADLAASLSQAQPTVAESQTEPEQETEPEESEPAMSVFVNEVLPAMPEVSADEVQEEAVAETAPDAVEPQPADTPESAPVEPEETASAPEEMAQDALPEEAECDEETADEVVTPELGIVRKPLFKYMTINDKFRFRRELFSNSDPVFREALSLIETMESMEEVNDYFFNDLQWDPESDEVKEFSTLVERYLAEGSK